MKKKLIFLMALMSALSVSATAFAIVVSRHTTPPAGAVKKTPDTNLFSLEGGADKWVLIDSTDEGFFVTPTQNLGKHAMDADNTCVFDPEDTNNIAYFLNNDYLTTGYGNKILPQQMKEHLVLRNWATESGNTEVDYVYTECKVALLSVEEYLKYADVIGCYDDESWWGWYTRTPYLNTPTSTALAIGGEQGGVGVQVNANIVCGIKPVFYLDKDFFKEEKINLNTVGHNIRKAMQENYTKQELSAIYGEAEITQIFAEVPPIAYDVWTIGYNNVGDTMTAYYKYSSPEGKPENGTTYRWVRCDELNSDLRSTIKGATGMTYTLTEEDAGKYVYFEVTPATATAVGNSYLSLSYEGQQVIGAYKPTAEDIKIHGDANMGETLEVTYLFKDKNRELEGDTLFQWQREKNGTYYNISGATNTKYQVTPQDIGYKLRCCITPVSSATYDKTGYTNNGKYSVGDVYCSELTETVAALPEAKNVVLNNRSAHSSIGIKDDVLTFAVEVKSEDEIGKRLCINYDFYDYSGIAEGESEYVWELSNRKDGNFIALENENLPEYVITEGNTARYVRCGVTPVNKNGTRGKTVYSSPLLIAGDEYEFSDNGVDSTEVVVTKNENLVITAEKLKNPYAISFKITAGNNAEIASISSSNYTVYTNKIEGGFYCMLIKNGNVLIENGAQELAQVSVLASGTEKVYIDEFTYAGIGFDGKAQNNTILPESITLNIR